MQRYEYDRYEGDLYDGYLQNQISDGWRIIGWKWFDQDHHQEWLLERPIEEGEE